MYELPYTHANNIDADKPVPTYSLIGTFVVRYLDSIISWFLYLNI